MMMTEAIRLIITGNSAGAVKALEEVGVAAGMTSKTVGSKLTAMNSVASKMVIPFVAMAAIVGKSVLDYERFAITVAKVKAQTDMSAEATSRFVGQLQMMHVDTSKAGMALKTMENAIYGLKTGASASVDTFKILNLTWADLKDLAPEDQIGLIRDRLSQLQDPAAKSQAATKLLGRGAKDMALWYDASAAAMAKVNTELEKNGQIMSEGQLEDAAKAAAAWKDFAGSMKGFEYALARGVLPALTLLVKGLTELTRLLKPFAPILGPVTIALGVFIFAIKTAVFFQKAWNQLLGLFPARAATAAGAERGLGVATATTTGAMKGQILQIGLIGIALGALILIIMKVVDAYNQWADAARKEKEQLADLKKNLDAITPADQAKLAAAAAAYKGPGPNPYATPAMDTGYKPPSGFWGWAKEYEKSAMAGAAHWMGYAGGTDHITNGPEAFVAGEAGRERVTVTPLGRRGGGMQVIVNQHFHGPVVGGRQGMRELSDIVKRDVMSGVQRAMVGQHA